MHEQEPSTDIESAEAMISAEPDPLKGQEFPAQLERQQNLPVGVVAIYSARWITGEELESLVKEKS